MISCLLCGVSLLYAYFVSKKILLLFIALLMFLLAAGCHQRLEKRVTFLEEQMKHVIKAWEEQVDVNKSISKVIHTLASYKDLGGDDLK